jgi:hypothetical protein
MSIVSDQAPGNGRPSRQARVWLGARANEIAGERPGSIGLASLLPLLVLQSLLLAGFLILCVAARSRVDPDAASLIFAGMPGRLGRPSQDS